MCRLVAMSREKKIVEPPEKYIFGMFLCVSSRLGNTHGVGAMVNTPQPDWIKSGLKAEEFVFQNSWDDWWNSQQAEVDTILGHTRLASSAFRNGHKWDEPYPDEHAHPHEFTNFSIFHNGTFFEYEKLAKELGVENENLTDSGVFLRLLVKHNQEKFTDRGLVAALKEVGKADYSMMIQRHGTSDIFLVRGNRNVFVAKSNYGLLVNTDKKNIDDLPINVNDALSSFGYDRLVTEEPKELEEYTLFSLKEGSLTKIVSFGEEVKAINSPPVAKSEFIVLPARRNSTPKVDGDRVLSKVKLLLDFCQGSITMEEHHRLALTELYENKPSIAHYSLAELSEYADILKWAREELPECAPSEEKTRLWQSISDALWSENPTMLVREIYEESGLRANKTVDVPFFHNTLELLEEVYHSL